MFRLLSLKHFQKRPLKIFLTLIGVATGIAVFVSVDLTNRSILRGLEYSFAQISGGSHYSIEGRSRQLTDQDFLLAGSLPGARAAAFIETEARCGSTPETRFTLLGIDPLTPSGLLAAPANPEVLEKFLRMLAEPDTILVPDSLATRCGFKENQVATLSIAGRPHPLKAIVLTPSQSANWPPTLAWIDLATAQELLERRGLLSRIEIQVSGGENQAWLQNARERFPPGLSIDSSGERLNFQRELLKAFQLNLLALSLVAVFVSGFVVFNAASLTVLQRRKEIGTLRALGASRRRIAGLFLKETLVLGVTGSVLGIALGWLLSRLVFKSILATVQDLYLTQATALPEFPISSALLAVGLGTLMALIGAFLPLLEALQVTPIEATRRVSFEKQLRGRAVWPALVAAFSFGLTLLFAYLSATGHPSFGFAAALSSLASFLFLTPYFLKCTLSVFKCLAQRLGLSSLFLVASQMLQNPYRYSVVTAAFSLGVALWIGVGTMIHSFRETVTTWIGSSIRGDVYLTLLDNRRGNFQSFMPDELLAWLNALPEGARIDTLRAVQVWSGNERIALSAVALEDLIAHGQLQFQQGSPDAFLNRSHRGVEPFPAAVAESLARRLNWQAGDVVSIDTTWGTWKIQVSGVVHDYTTERGLIYLDRRDFAQRSGDTRVNSIAIYLKNGGDAVRLIREVETFRPLPPGLVIQPNAELRRRILNIFEQTFRVTEALKYVALLVAFLGILTTLAALLEEKYREIGILQAVGMGKNQLSLYGLSQGLLLAFAGFLLGAVTGVALCLILLKVIHLNYFGWTIFFHPDFGLLARSFILTLLVGAAATLWPIHLLRKIRPAVAIRYEE